MSLADRAESATEGAARAVADAAGGAGIGADTGGAADLAGAATEPGGAATDGAGDATESAGVPTDVAGAGAPAGGAGPEPAGVPTDLAGSGTPEAGGASNATQAAPPTERPASVPFDEVLERVREFARKELLPHQSEFDALPEPPVPACAAFQELGLGGWWLPQRFGGLGLGLEQSVDIVSELAYGDAGVAFTLFISILGTTGVLLYGDDETKARYLPAVAQSGEYAATLGSERAAGSELTKIATTAARTANEVVINGDKFFSTNAGFASFLVVFARSAANADEHLAIVVPGGTDGVRVMKRWEMIGLRSSGTYQVSFQRCRVPSSGVLNGPGLRILEVALNASRILIASTALGIARRVRDMCMEYGKRKRLADKPLVRNPVFAAKLGQIEMDIDAMRHVCLSAGREFDALMGRPDAADEFLRRGTLKSALTAKNFCGQTGWKIASAGSEMFGGLGYTRELAIDKLVRDTRHVSIIEGGDDVLRELVFNRYVVSGGGI